MDERRSIRLLFPLLLAACVDGAKILVLPPMVSNSHKIAMVTWADVLASRNHTIFWWAPAPKLDKYQPLPGPNVHVYHFEVDLDPSDYDQQLVDAVEYENSTVLSDMVWNVQYSVPFVESSIFKAISPYCKSVIKNNAGHWSEISSTKFDLIILDELFNPCGYVLTALAKLRHKTPTIVYVSTCRQTKQSMETNGLHTPYSHVPHMGSLSILSDRLNFRRRLETVLSYIIGDVGYTLNYMGVKRLLIDPFYPELKNLHFRHSIEYPWFQVYCLPRFFDFATPLAPNHAYVGGLQMDFQRGSSAEIDPELNILIQTFPRGFILVAMGHFTNFNAASNETRQVFVKAFAKIASELKMLIIWQYKGPEISIGLPSNVKLMKWIPQQQLLAHPKCNLLVTHGGCNSVTESLWNGVPLVVIPLFADQGDAAARVQSRGLGEAVRKSDLSAENLFNAMSAVLKSDKYVSNAKKFAAIIKSLGYPRGQTPENRALFWTEFVLNHGKVLEQRGEFSYLRLPKFVREHSVFVLFCLDVIFFMFILFCIFAFLVSKIITRIFGTVV